MKRSTRKILVSRVSSPPPGRPKSPRETEILLPIYKDRSGFAILTEECLTFRTVSPGRFCIGLAEHVTIIKGDELKKYISEYVRKNFSRDRLAGCVSYVQSLVFWWRCQTFSR